MTGAGYRAHVIASSASVPDADVLVALHAQRSAALVAAYRARFPEHPIVVVLTGTDVYGPRGLTPTALKTLHRADAIVALQPLAVRHLPPALRKRAIAVIQSAHGGALTARSRRTGRFRFCVLGHLRREKDPLRAALALRYVTRRDVEVVQAGGVIESRYRARLVAIAARDARYRYLGELSRAHSLRLLATSDALILPSRSEGGANVASEAIANGVPVLASRIEGNVGIFGREYGGYYPVGSSESLGALMERVAADPAFARTLRRQICALRALVAPARERDALLQAIELACHNRER